MAFDKVANSYVIASMVRVLDDYEAGRISSEDVEKSLESHMQALEGIGLSSIHSARNLSHRLVSAHLHDGVTECKDDDRVQAVLTELRTLLLSLPA